MSLISPIYRMGEPNKRTPAEEDAARREARRVIWREHGLAVIDPEDIHDDWERQAVINIAEKQYGRRGRQ